MVDGMPAEPDPPPEEHAERFAAVRAGAVAGGRVVAGVIGVVVAVTMIAAAALLPLPAVRGTPQSIVVTPAPAPQQLVCPGSLLRLGNESGEGAAMVTSLGTPTRRSAAGSGKSGFSPLAVSDAGTGGTLDAPQLLSETEGSAGVQVSGAQLQVVSSGDFAGLAGASCTAPTSDAWLVGGSTTVGRTTILTIANPSDVTATVDLSIFAEGGAISAPGLTGIAVPAHSERVFSLAGFAPESESPVVHVTSTGGQVVANIQQATVRGLEPGGVDLVGAGAPPSGVNVIPGVVVEESEALRARLGETGFGDLETVVRVLVPDESATVAVLSIVPENGAATMEFSFELEGGRVTDLPIDALADGSYTVIVETDTPAVAAVRVSGPATEDLTDFAWMPAVAPLAADAQVTVAPGASAAVHLANLGESDDVILLTAVTGGEISVPVAAGAAVSAPVDAGSTYVIADSDAVYASLSARAPAGVAGYGVNPPAPLSTPVVIYP